MPTPSEENSGKSLHDIASLLVRSTPPVEDATALDTPKKSPPEGKQKEAVVLEEPEIDEDAPEDWDGDQDEDQDEDDDTTGDKTEDQQDDADDEEEAGSDDEPEEAEADYVEIRDTDIIEVMVDGELTEFSIADAKKALSGEGAIDKRLKDATEARKKAQADHALLLDQFSQTHATNNKLLGDLHGIMFKPSVAKPDAALRQRDANAYLRQMDAYEADQVRVGEGQKALEQLMAKRNEAMGKHMHTYREGQAQALVQAIPDMGDPEKSNVLLPKMAKFAMDAYGYSADEVQMASDHRMYKMIFDLMQLSDARRPSPNRGEKVMDLTGQANKRPRKLRSGATSSKAKSRQNAEKQAKVTSQARTSGKVKDVAATLIKRK
jgi:hypothetical protein